MPGGHGIGGSQGVCSGQFMLILTNAWGHILHGNAGQPRLPLALLQKIASVQGEAFAGDRWFAVALVVCAWLVVRLA